MLLWEGKADHSRPIVSRFNRRLNLVAFIWNGIKDVPGPDFSRSFSVEIHNLRSVDGILRATDTR